MAPESPVCVHRRRACQVWCWWCLSTLSFIWTYWIKASARGLSRGDYAQQEWNTSSLAHSPRTREPACFDTTPSRRTLEGLAILKPDWSTVESALVIPQRKAQDSTSAASTAPCLFADRDLKRWLKNPTQGYCWRKLLLATICSSLRFFLTNTKHPPEKEDRSP